MFGLIHRFTAHPGQRDRLASLMTEAGAPAGCLSLVVAQDPGNSDGLWVTEVWESENAWRTAIDRPDLQDTIRQSQQLIASFDAPVTTRPVAILP